MFFLIIKKFIINIKFEERMEARNFTSEILFKILKICWNEVESEIETWKFQGRDRIT